MVLIKIHICRQTKMKIPIKTYISWDGRHLFAVNGSLVTVTATPKVPACSVQTPVKKYELTELPVYLQKS